MDPLAAKASRDIARFSARPSSVRVLSTQRGIVVASAHGVTATNTQTFTNNTTSTFLAAGHMARIRFAGTLRKVAITLVATTWIVSIKFRVFRYNGATYDEVGSGSEDIVAASLSVGANLLTLGTPIAGVQAGDYLAVVLTSSGGGNQGIALQTGLTAGDWTWRYTSGTDVSGAGVSFASATASCSMKLVAYVDAPHVAFVGDSVAASSPTGRSFVQTVSTWAGTPTVGMSGRLFTWRDLSVFNAGIGSSTADGWDGSAGYLVTYILPALPQAVVVCLGANDIGVTGTGSWAASLPNMNDILRRLQSNGIQAIFMTVPQLGSFNAAALLKVRDWNRNLAYWCATHGVPLLDSWTLLSDDADSGAYHANIIAGGDGTHPNSVGYDILAGALLPMIDII